jgi:hypothetical protein
MAVSEQQYRAKDGIVARLAEGGMMASKAVRLDSESGRSELIHG